MPCILELPELAEQLAAHARKQMRGRKAARRNQFVDHRQGGCRALGN